MGGLVFGLVNVWRAQCMGGERWIEELSGRILQPSAQATRRHIWSILVTHCRNL